MNGTTHPAYQLSPQPVLVHAVSGRRQKGVFCLFVCLWCNVSLTVSSDSATVLVYSHNNVHVKIQIINWYILF